MYRMLYYKRFPQDTLTYVRCTCVEIMNVFVRTSPSRVCDADRITFAVQGIAEVTHWRASDACTLGHGVCTYTCMSTITLRWWHADLMLWIHATGLKEMCHNMKHVPLLALTFDLSQPMDTNGPVKSI